MNKLFDYLLPYAKMWTGLAATAFLTIVNPGFIDGLTKVLGADLSDTVDLAIVNIIIALVIYLVPNAESPAAK